MAITDRKRHVRRVASLYDLPYQSLRCAANGHRWNDPAERPVTGWGDNVDAGELNYECPCGRWKHEIVDDDTGEILTRDYGGGTLTHVVESRATARKILLARKREKRQVEAASGDNVRRVSFSG
jgi:hypothetical protein